MKTFVFDFFVELSLSRVPFISLSRVQQSRVLQYEEDPDHGSLSSRDVASAAVTCKEWRANLGTDAAAEHCMRQLILRENLYRRVEPDYMRIQPHLNDKMRAILIDWVILVHRKFSLMPETLFLAPNRIDLFLSKKVVTRKNLQLVGVTAMLLASKYEEIWAPEVRDFVYISDKAYTREQILDMEKQMLNTLGFHLTVPTPYQFMSRFFKAANADKQFQLLSSFIVESSLPDYSMLKYPGSLLAASAVYVAMKTLGSKGVCDDVMKKVGMLAHNVILQYTEADILPCAEAMSRIARESATPTSLASFGSTSAIHKKYSLPQCLKVAQIKIAQLCV